MILDVDGGAGITLIFFC